MDRDQWKIQDFFNPAPLHGGFAMEGYWVWCGSVVRGEDGRYHMFASRWEKKYPFHPGWAVASEIVRAVSSTPEGPYTFQEVVLSPRGAGYWDGRATHNPSIQKYGNQYILFYMGTTYPYPDIQKEDGLNHDSYQFLSARANKRIGIAVSDSVFGPWRRMDKPVLDVRPGAFDDFFTSNPAPCINPDGSCLLVYKTRTWKKPPYDSYTNGNQMFSDMKFGAAFAKHWAGPYERLKEEAIFQGEGILEDPFIWQKSQGGYAMIAKDWSGMYTGSPGDGVYAESKDGIKWDIKEGVSYTKDILWSDGKIRRMGNMDRPFLLFDDKGEATHLFVATNDGDKDSFITMKNSWNACIPLK